MQTPNDINGVRTDLIMQTINKELYADSMPIPEYNRMYEIVYKSLCKISIKNLHKSMQEIGINLFDTPINR